MVADMKFDADLLDIVGDIIKTTLPLYKDKNEALK